jgi:hypothetical protein
MVFDAATAATNGTGAHRLLGTSAGNIEFVTGSLFRTGANAAGNPFGTATATNGAVTFRNGSRYEQLGGQNPFSLAQPTSIAIFEPSSYYYYGVTGTTPPSLSGRTYGILEYNVGNGNGNTSGVANPVTVVGDLIITSGDVHLDLNGGVILKGNVLVNGSSSLSFNPSSTATVQLNGTTPQTIGGTAPAGAITIGTNSTLQVNNAAGVVLARSLALRRLTLTSGTVTTTATNLLTLSSTAILNGGSATSFVNGPLARDTPAGLSTPTSYVFPIGKASFYRPFTLNLSSQIDASTYTAEQIEGDPNPAGAANLLPINGFGSAPLKRVSKFRGFLLASTNATNNNAIGTLTLSFGIGDGVNNPGDAGLVVGVSSGGSGFGNLDRSASTGTGTGPGGTDVVGTLTSTIIPTATASALFVLAATNENNTIGQAINPLPVELTSISAQRQADKAVAVKWATATEKSSNYFQVQRSLDGREFATVATVTARGTSSQATAYTSLDKTAPMATLYYRLRQVDLDGTAAYSPVVTVAGTERTTLHLYPNPATEVLHVDAPAATSYRVLNLLGQLVLTGTTAEGATLNVRTLPAGAYLLELHTAQGRQVSKFTKE